MDRLQYINHLPTLSKTGFPVHQSEALNTGSSNMLTIIMKLFFYGVQRLLNKNDKNNTYKNHMN